MKGQFMVLSSVVISLIVLSAAGTIGTIQSTSHSVDRTSRYVNMIQDEAKKVTPDDKEDIENFKRMIDTVNEYDAAATYWDSRNCFNVTMYRPGQRISLNCVPVS